MARLLAAEIETVGAHTFQNVTVADGRADQAEFKP